MRGNPLKAYLSDQQFEDLMEKGFLNERAVRDHYIREQFARLKSENRPKEIIHQLQSEFPYLSVDTVRKIVYSRGEVFEAFHH